MRVLVTGSRDWPYPHAVEQELAALLGKSPLVVVQGGAKGADAAAYLWACHMQNQGVYQVRPETHDANWTRDGKAAGFIRNQQMVNLGADLCLAFIFNDSKGASHCRERALWAGIPTRTIRLNIEEVK